jgi:Ni/Co efflux regulator RcnB
MNKTIITALAVFALAAPFAAAQPDHQPQQQGQYDGQRSDQSRGDRGHDQANDRGGRHHRRQAWRDTNRDARWDDSQHNGYYANNQWHYGPPPQSMAGRRNVTLGYHPWARGQRLGYYNSRYSEVDYRRENLRQPRRGYHWVRDNEGDFLLAVIATGVITQIVLNNR